MTTSLRTSTRFAHAANSDTSAIAVWVLTRVGLLLTAWIAGSALLGDGSGLDGYLSLWNRWETPYYESIAVEGYAPSGAFEHNSAYFPGLAILMKAGLLLGLPAPATGMLVALLGSLAAVLALTRLTQLVGGGGIYGVLAWTLAPIAVFLVAPWAEAAFAGLSFWAWLEGRRGNWIAAGALAAGAAAFRINGLLLACALVLMFVLSRPIQWRHAWALSLPIGVTAAHFGYLWIVTGDPFAWFTAHRVGWDRNFTDPLTSLGNTIDLIWSFNDGLGAPHSRFVVEIIAVVVLIAVGGILLFKRWWAESFYVLITVASLATSTFYYSVPRAAVVLVPVWMLLGLWMTRYRWFRYSYLLVCTPLLVLVTVRFVEGQWIS